MMSEYYVQNDRPLPPQSPLPPRSSFLGSVARGVLKSLFVLVFLLSLLLNVYLLVLVSARIPGRFDTRVLTEGDRHQVVALYHLEGMIDDDVAADFDRFVQEVEKDGDIKAVVLRINSPGGGVSASDRIHERVLHLRSTGRNVVVSMGNVAASGGYFVASGADEILAEPGTLTGSIGVMMGWAVFSGTLDRIGVEPIVLTSNDARGWKDEISFVSAPDQRQRRHLQELLDKMQDRFESIVREGRGSRLQTQEVTYPLEIVENNAVRTVEHTETAPFNGKIYLAEEALDYGLIDSIGYQQAAVDRAAELAGLPRPTVREYRVRRGLMDALIGMEARASNPLGVTADDLRGLQTPRVEMVWRVAN